MLWAIHTRSGMRAHGARRRNNQRPASARTPEQWVRSSGTSHRKNFDNARSFFTSQAIAEFRFNPRGFVLTSSFATGEPPSDDYFDVVTP